MLKVETNAGEGPAPVPSFPSPLRRKETFPGEKKRRSRTKKTKLQRFMKGSSSCSLFPSPLRRKEAFPEEKKKRSHTKKKTLQRFMKGSPSCTFVSFATSPKRNFFRGKRKGGLAQRKRSFKGSQRLPLRVPSFPLRLRRKETFSGGKEKEVSHKENEASKVHEGFFFVLLFSLPLRNL
jgi:hypothetical protein